jgi:hypothetical protein
MDYLPQALNAYINDTLEDGSVVAFDLYDDIREEVLRKSEARVDALTRLCEGFLERARGIHDSVQAVRKCDEPA